MPPRTDAVWDYEILDATGAIWIGLMLVKPDDWKPGDPLTVPDALSAQTAETPLSQDLHEQVQEDWSGGIGHPTRGYNAAYGLITHIPGYVLMAGAATAVSVPGGSGGPVVAFAEYNGDLYFAQEGTSTVAFYGAVHRLTGGTGAASLIGEINVTAGMDLTGATYFIRDMIVADGGAGTSYLFVSASDANGLNGVIYRYDGTTWTNSTVAFGGFGAKGMNRLAKVFWTTSDGTPAWRMVAITGPKTFAYTLPNGDPRDDAQWSADIRIDTNGELKEIAAFRRRIFIAATDGLYDIDELGQSSEVTGYLHQTPNANNGDAVLAQDGYVYMSTAAGTIRVKVDDASLDEFALQGQCTPGWGTAAEGVGRGRTTAFANDQGYIMNAIHDVTTQTTNIYRGIDRRIAVPDYPAPVVWYGPEIVYGADYKVTRMHVSGLVSGAVRLWIAALSVAGSTPKLDWISMPLAGNAFQDIISGGAMRFCTGNDGIGNIVQPYSRLETLKDTWGNKAERKILFSHTIGSEGPLSATNKIDLETRADPAPGSTTWTAAGTADGSPTDEIVPGTVTAGNKTQMRLRFFAPNGGATPPVIPVLDSIRTLAWKIAPSVRIWAPTFEYGDGVINLRGGFDSGPDRNPDTITAQLKALSEAGKTTMRDRNDQVWTVKVRQVQEGREILIDDGEWGKKKEVTMQISVVAGPL